MDPQLTRIAAKLAEAAGGRPTFGSHKHGYRPHPPLPESADSHLALPSPFTPGGSGDLWGPDDPLEPLRGTLALASTTTAPARRTWWRTLTSCPGTNAGPGARYGGGGVRG